MDSAPGSSIGLRFSTEVVSKTSSDMLVDWDLNWTTIEQQTAVEPWYHDVTS